jgi:hypothetical protein
VLQPNHGWSVVAPVSTQLDPVSPRGKKLHPTYPRSHNRAWYAASRSRSTSTTGWRVSSPPSGDQFPST